VTADEDESEATVGLTGGLDFRIELSRGVRVVAGHRVHVLAGAKDVAARPDFQQRFGVGLQVAFGAR